MQALYLLHDCPRSTQLLLSLQPKDAVSADFSVLYAHCSHNVECSHVETQQLRAVKQAAPLRADAPTPMPLFSAGAATPFNAPGAPVFSGNTGPSAFLSGQEGSSAAEPTLRPTSRPTPGLPQRTLVA